VEEGDLQDVANIVWALAVTGLDSQGAKRHLGRFWDCLMGSRSEQLSKLELDQISYVGATAKLEGMELREPPPVLQSRLDRVQYESNPLKVQKQVSNHLRKLGFEHEYEVSPFEGAPGLLAIDMACKKGMVAIEFDGPRHFLKGTDFVELSSTENGTTKAKRRLLQRLGWTVINLDWKEYKKCNSNTKWLKFKLGEAGVET
jgi:hypothetical protein